MQSSLILYLILALLFSLVVAYYQYYFKQIKQPRITSILFVLKALSLFLLIVLFINPKINTKETSNSKPVLSVLVDDSKSVTFFNESSNTNDFIKSLEDNNDVISKFDLQKFSFGKDLQVLDTLGFIKPQTNIYNAILTVDKLQTSKIAPFLLITDGNQTIGTDYEFINVKQPIYPIVIGDTTKYVDVKISQLNVNKYSYIKNKFPVEVILNYEGDKNVTTQFSISNKGKIVYRKNIRFSASKKSQTITANLTSVKEGLQYYTASVSKIENEKNLKNNSKSFSVEVIDEQTKVLLLTSVLHPDLGGFKKSIERNKQRLVEIFNIDNFYKEINDYQLVVLFNPNNKFNSVIQNIKQNNRNFLLISGVNTDWNFINQKQLGFSKNAINQSENYGTLYNDSFLTFLQEDIGFNNFPPLKDKFGEITITKEHQTLLYQTINGVVTKQPQIISFDVNNQKSGVIFGEGLWRWRANSFLNTNSFEDFDNFIGNLIQYLASNKKRSRLEVNAESIYPANSTINISAFYTDKNYQFDARASLEVTITNLATKTNIKVPFSLVNNAFQTEIEDLISGDYQYKVTVLGQNMNKTGRFKITDFEIEEQFTNANVNKLQKLADKTGGKLFYINQKEEIITELMKNESFYTVQKSTVKQQNLIDWKWILFLIVSLLTIEWFIRKYYGKV